MNWKNVGIEHIEHVLKIPNKAWTDFIKFRPTMSRGTDYWIVQVKDNVFYGWLTNEKAGIYAKVNAGNERKATSIMDMMYWALYVSKQERRGQSV